MADITSIETQQELANLAATLGVRPDWHEPDEQGVSARIVGTHLDNAFGSTAKSYSTELPTTGETFDYGEFNVIISKSDADSEETKDIAVVNLATLLAMASGTWRG